MSTMVERFTRLSCALGAITLFALLSALWLSDPLRAEGLAGVIASNLPESGVDNPVTAVLLNFRAIDTLLEIAVLLLTLVGVWALRNVAAEDEQVDPALPFASLLHLSVPMIIVIGGYLLWIGAKAPGGAFQAGAVLAGAAVLMRLSGKLALSAAILRWMSVVGLAVFLGCGVIVLAQRGALLDFPAASAGIWILIIETAATLSIATILSALFIGAEPKKTETGLTESRPGEDAG